MLPASPDGIEPSAASPSAPLVSVFRARSRWLLRPVTLLRAHAPNLLPSPTSGLNLQGRSSGRNDRRRLEVRAEGQQTAIAILHHELARVPWHVGKSPSEFYALRCVLGIKCVGIFDEQVRVEQFVPVFVRIGCGRLGAAEVNRLLVASHDGIDRRILPRPQTFEAKLVFVIGERSGNVYGEEQRRNLTDHLPSLLHTPAGADARVSPVVAKGRPIRPRSITAE